MNLTLTTDLSAKCHYVIGCTWQKDEHNKDDEGKFRSSIMGLIESQHTTTISFSQYSAVSNAFKNVVTSLDSETAHAYFRVPLSSSLSLWIWIVLFRLIEIGSTKSSLTGFEAIYHLCTMLTCSVCSSRISRIIPLHPPYRYHAYFMLEVQMIVN